MFTNYPTNKPPPHQKFAFARQAINMAPSRKNKERMSNDLVVNYKGTVFI